MSKTCVLLINLGTPDSPSTKDVRKYLFEFLNDPRVIDINPIGRFFLVNFIIVPFRAPKSAKIYKELWTKDGSPIMIYGESVKEKLQKELGNNFEVELAMRYQNPGLDEVCARMEKKGYEKIIIIPLFPQYASASTGSAIDKAMKLISKWWVIPEIKIISQFYDNEDYLNCVIEQSKKYNLSDYDHILFSYHGLPVRQVDKVYSDGKPCADHKCEDEINEDNKYCYKATCYATTRLLAAKLNLPKERYTVCFQSRLDKDWLEPFSDKVVEEWAKKGAKKLLVFSPAFVADCLETTVEIGIEYQNIFKEHGGEKVQLVESLNDHPMWIETLKKLVLKEG
ncbi:MAG: ferrochelatase [Ignavibacteriaceae bacterium]|nr:ferrochelatase [Ignavibacteriaceae bacterium]HRN26619.1 ferrochelatase [Ignavibacteriaceae bacterium]HRP91965.1 ferrochelatase [Ignavibacteriaceae bacterium]HRQ54253.1 ferrochelatase [Ignavibacteriaceae bacterium]